MCYYWGVGKARRAAVGTVWPVSVTCNSAGRKMKREDAPVKITIEYCTS